MKVLALDHGRTRTGAAVSDPTGTIVRPLGAIRRIDTPEGQRHLERVIAAERPDWIVVGEPRHLSGETGAQARAATAFADRLRARVPMPVQMLDERLTTVEARRRRREAGSSGDLDSLAACVLLEAFLSRAANAGDPPPDA